MPFTSLRSVLPVTILAGALLVAATGCTSSTGSARVPTPVNPPSSQPAAAPTSAPNAATSTKADACKLLGTSLQTLSAKMTTASTQLQSDPKAGVAQLEAATTEFDGAVKTIVDPGAAAVAKTADVHLTALVASAKAALADPSKGAGAMQGQLTTIQSDFAKIGAYCQ